MKTIFEKLRGFLLSSEQKELADSFHSAGIKGAKATKTGFSVDASEIVKSQEFKSIC